jgi:DNA-binding YbaB/EbfC family protein
MNDFGNLKGLFETAQKLESEMARVKEELARKTVSGETGGGLVRCTASGKGDVLELVIDANLVPDAGNRKMLEDLLVGAVNLALDRARQLAQDEVARVGGGLQLPPGLFGGAAGGPFGGS